jgi:hypothetical protein
VSGDLALPLLGGAQADMGQRIQGTRENHHLTFVTQLGAASEAVAEELGFALADREVKSHVSPQ